MYIKPTPTIDDCSHQSHHEKRNVLLFALDDDLDMDTRFIRRHDYRQSEPRVLNDDEIGGSRARQPQRDAIDIAWTW